MAELNVKGKAGAQRIRHKGRGSQILIYLGKQLRFFVNESDWKVLPMAGIIAALVGLVIRRRFFLNMEGCLLGGFALACVAIWNGCFNSIQSVCRERPIIKREHRAGMHVTSYVAAHMIYQFLLCLVQTGVTMYVLMIVGVRFPLQGFMTPLMIVDIGISILLISYASDMMSLFLSSISHTTTGAMTIMPFVLIFQLVFSGGIIPLPASVKNLSNLTISNYGIKALVSQAGYNEQPMVAVWNTLNGMRDREIDGTVTLGQLMEVLDVSAVEKYRDTVVVPSLTVGEAADILEKAGESLHLKDRTMPHPVTLRSVLERLRTSEAFAGLRANELIPSADGEAGVTVGTLLDAVAASKTGGELLDREIGANFTLGRVLEFLHVREVADALSDRVLNKPVTLGEAADFLRNSKAIQSRRDKAFTFKVTVGEVIDMIGEDNVRDVVQIKTAQASRNASYERTPGNIARNWAMLAVFIAGFALLSVLALELIDRDKR